MKRKRGAFKTIALAAGILCVCFFCCSSAFGDIVSMAYKNLTDYYDDGHPESVKREAVSSRSYDLPIIMYHAVYPRGVGKYVIRPETLEEDLKYLSANGYITVTVSDVLAFTERGVPMPEKPVMLTFDDAALSVYLYAWPILKEYGVKFIVSPVGALTDANYGADGVVIKNKRSHMNWEQLKELYESGLCEIQNHTYDMHKQTVSRRGLKRNKYEDAGSYKTTLLNDLDKMRVRIREKTGAESAAVAYPFGAYTKDIGQTLKEAGYKAGFTCYEKINRIDRGTDLFFLNRINRPGNMPAKVFFQRKIK